MSHLYETTQIYHFWSDLKLIYEILEGSIFFYLTSECSEIIWGTLKVIYCLNISEYKNQHEQKIGLNTKMDTI